MDKVKGGFCPAVKTLKLVMMIMMMRGVVVILLHSNVSFIYNAIKKVMKLEISSLKTFITLEVKGLDNQSAIDLPQNWYNSVTHIFIPHTGNRPGGGSQILYCKCCVRGSSKPSWKVTCLPDNINLIVVTIITYY